MSQHGAYMNCLYDLVLVAHHTYYCYDITFESILSEMYYPPSIFMTSQHLIPYIGVPFLVHIKILEGKNLKS